MTFLAIAFAAVAACFFSGAVVLQHGAVRAEGAGAGARALGRIVRRPRWLGGTVLAGAGSALHLTALSLAPLAIVQPVGVLSLVVTVVVTRRAASPSVRAAVAAVCAGVGGFVLLSAAGGTAAPNVDVGQAELNVLIGLGIAVIAWCAKKRAGCLGLSASAALLFGLGSAVMRAASEQSPGAAIPLVSQAIALMVAGGWLMHQAYAAGPAAVVVGATTVLDPLTAVGVGILVYGEKPHLSAALAILQVAFALTAVAGVRVLAAALPETRPGSDPDREMEPPMDESRLRVLIGADTFPPDINGAAHFTGRLAHGLAALGHDVHVLSPSPIGAAHTLAADGITVHRVRSMRTPFHPTFRFCTSRQAARAAGPLLDELQPDLVHVQAHFGVCRALLGAAAERAIPAIATNHFMPENLLGYAPFLNPVRGPLMRWAWRDLVRVYRHTAAVTTPTPRAADLLSANGFPGHAQVISCGIDLDHYAADDTRRGGDFSVLFVGRLDAEKNIGELIRALAPLPGVRADIVGDGSCRQDLVDLATDLGVADRVHFHGVVSDAELVQCYRNASAFCMPGTAELQSIATMEAMAAGLPVLAADAMALPHLVYSGLNGFLFPPGDVETLTTHLAELAADPATRAAMGEASRHVVARHDIAKTLHAFEDLYRAVAGFPVRTRVAS